jgi:cyclic beta-1,2-glucan synthetase
MQAASLVLASGSGKTSQQIDWSPPKRLPTLVASRTPDWNPSSLPAEPKLAFDNGYGGYDAARREYLVRIAADRPTPAPWCNVLANPGFGVLVGSGGSQCTWADNSSENRITPWLNDPTGESSGEILYLRDEETGEVWSPTPGPAGDKGPWRLRHGLGYSVFEHAGKELIQSLEIHVDSHHPVKICRLTLSNRSDWTRRITAPYYLEWVLGTNRGDHAIHLRCETWPKLNAVLAGNPFSPRYGNKRAFLAANMNLHGYTTCRTEFLGSRGSLARPAALGRLGLSGNCLPGSDPCGAIQVHLDIPPGQERSVSFLIGQGDDPEAAEHLLQTMLQSEAMENSRRQAEADITGLLSRVQVQTSEPAFDLMVNHWLPWQALMGRLWGRTGYYQSSGAFGFRDQLQDVLALLWMDPQLVRAHLLKAASRQFLDGDVLHWWHEDPLRGVRTRCSDDLLWLPYAVAHYLRSTGDTSILDESVPYLAGDPLQPEESERYCEFQQSERSESLYEHCKRAIDRATTVGPHGLPTIGNGDWNDGFNRVSVTGRGESVWLAWFLIRVLKDFAPCCEIQGEESCVRLYRQLAEDLLERVESVAWDGQWYQRAYFDDGTPLGSANGEECRIDLIAQAWSVLAQEKTTERSRQAMASALEYLVDEDHRLIKLLSPPFDKGRADPGYIKGYPPGIRENGAQYTHAATWSVWAMARLGDGEKAMQLFRLLNPLLRTSDREACEHYRLEPYVLAGDIYSVGQNRGRGGWSWYTGAAAWLYRSALESLLGLQRHGDCMLVDPCLPAQWPGFSASLRRGRSLYRITASRAGAADGAALVVRLDGVRQASNRFAFVDDGNDHSVEIRLPH